MFDDDTYYQGIDRYTGEKLTLKKLGDELIALLTPNRPIRKYKQEDVVMVRRLGNEWQNT